MNTNITSTEFTRLSNLVANFEGDRIAACFANKLVKPVVNLGDRVMFQTVDGQLFTVYSSKLKR